jgi:hypothetical protein
MKRFTMAIAMSCVLSVSALATDGEVPSGGLKAPPNDPPAPTAPGEIPNGGFTQEVTETALTLIQLALGAV